MAKRINEGFVSTLAVEWIEVPVLRKHRRKIFVSTLAVEWIEIAVKKCKILL